MSDPAISIVVCTRDRAESLARTLESLVAQRRADFEVVVVDQSADDATRQVVEGVCERDRRFQYHHLETAGLSRAYNHGIRSSGGQLLAFTDDDCVAPPEWLDSILTAFASFPDVLLVYGQVMLPPDVASTGEQGGSTPTLHIPERMVFRPRGPFKVFGMGANFAARREVFQLVGPFDEVLGGGGPLQSSQDFDFMYRVHRSGHATLLEPSVIVHHHGFRSFEDWPATMRAYGIGLGGFFVKHVRMGDVLAARLLLGSLARTVASILRHLTTERSPADKVGYARGIVTGMRLSFAYGIDRDLRLYRSR